MWGKVVSIRCSGQPALTQPAAKAINCHGYMFVSVCVDSDNDPGSAYGVGTCHRCLLMLDGISSSRPGEWTGLRGDLWPSSYQVTAHPIGALSGPPREQVDRSQGRHCAGPIMGQARAEEAWVGLSQSHSHDGGTSYRIAHRRHVMSLADRHGQKGIQSGHGGGIELTCLLES